MGACACRFPSCVLACMSCVQRKGRERRRSTTSSNSWTHTHTHTHTYTHAPPPKVRDWYVESFRELRSAPPVQGAGDEAAFTDLLRHIYRRHVRRKRGREGGPYHGLWLGRPLVEEAPGFVGLCVNGGRSCARAQRSPRPRRLGGKGAPRLRANVVVGVSPTDPSTPPLIPPRPQANVVPLMALGVSALKKELADRSFATGACAYVYVGWGRCVHVRRGGGRKRRGPSVWGQRVSGGGGREEGVVLHSERPSVGSLNGCRQWDRQTQTPRPLPNTTTPPPISEMPEIHQFLDGFYLSRIGIR